MTTIYDRNGKNTVGIADGPTCGSGDDDPRQGFAKPVASMTDDAVTDEANGKALFDTTGGTTDSAAALFTGTPVKPVASMTDDAAMLIKQPGDVDWDTLGRERALFNQQGAVLEKLDPLEKIVGANADRPSYVLRSQVMFLLQHYIAGVLIEETETSTGSPMLRVEKPSDRGVAVNITFTVARR